MTAMRRLYLERLHLRGGLIAHNKRTANALMRMLCMTGLTTLMIQCIWG